MSLALLGTIGGSTDATAPYLDVNETAEVTENREVASLRDASALSMAQNGTPNSSVTISYYTNGQCAVDLYDSGVNKTSDSRTFPAGELLSIGIYIAAVDDEVVEGNTNCPVVFSSSSDDPLYDQQTATMNVTVKDNDAVSHTLIRALGPGGRAGIIEGGEELYGDGDFGYIIADQPSAPVTITARTNEQCRFKAIYDPNRYDIGGGTYSNYARYTFEPHIELLETVIWNVYAIEDDIYEAVSYTHLTLPTTSRV